MFHPWGAIALVVAAALPATNAQIISGFAFTLNAGGTSCSDILTQCSFSGTCCSLTDYDETGCTFTVLGGTCSPSGSECPWKLSVTSTSSDACPVGDYDVLLDAEPTTTLDTISAAPTATAAPTTSPTVSLVPTISAAPTAKSTPKPTRGPEVCDWDLEIVRGSDSYIACSGDEESESKVITDGKCNQNSDIGYYKAFCEPGRGVEFVAVHCSNSDCTDCGGGNGAFMKSGEMYLSSQCNEVGEKGDPNRIGFKLVGGRAGLCRQADNCATSDASQGSLKKEILFGTLLSVAIALSIV